MNEKEIFEQTYSPDDEVDNYFLEQERECSYEEYIKGENK